MRVSTVGLSFFVLAVVSTVLVVVAAAERHPVLVDQSLAGHVYAIANVGISATYAYNGTYLQGSSPSGVTNDGSNPYIYLSQQWIVTQDTYNSYYIENAQLGDNGDPLYLTVEAGSVALSIYPYSWYLSSPAGSYYIITDPASGQLLSAYGLQTVELQPSQYDSDTSQQWNLNLFDGDSAFVQMSAALIAAINGQEHLALAYMTRVCSSNQNSSDPTLNQITQSGCQGANNLELGYSFFGEKSFYITPLDWQAYQTIVNDLIQIVTSYETWIADYNEWSFQRRTSESQTVLQSETYQAQLEYYEQKEAQQKAALAAQGQTIVYLQNQALTDYDNVKESMEAIAVWTNNTIKNITNEINQERTQDAIEIALQIMMDVMEIVIGCILCFFGDGAGGGMIAAGVAGLAEIPIEEAQQNASIAVLQRNITTLKQDEKNIQMLFNDITQLQDLVSMWLDPNVDLAQMLPNLTIVQLDWDTTNNYFIAIKGCLEKVHTPANQTAVFEDYIDASAQVIQYVRSWYYDAQALQDTEQQVASLNATQNYLKTVIRNEGYPLGQVMAAEAVQYTQMTKQIYLALQWMTQEIIQFKFTTLSNFSVTLGQNPNSADLMEIQEQIQSAVIAYYDGGTKASTLCKSAQFVVQYDEFPDAFESFYVNNTITINVPFPNVTNLYAVHFTQAHVYMIDPDHPLKPYKPSVEMLLTKAGQSIFLDSEYNQWTFNHAPVVLPFSYDPETYCNLTSQVELPEYINYSPYGFWTISRPTNQYPQTLAYKPTSFVLEFVVYYAFNPSSEQYPMFGRQTGTDFCMIPMCKPK